MNLRTCHDAGTGSRKDEPRIDAQRPTRPTDRTRSTARNALAATLTPDGDFDPATGHVLVIYDARHPEFGDGGEAESQWELAIAACRVSGLVRRLSWQRLMAAIAPAPELVYLVDGVGKKYGVEPH